jgi:hypothetical protein
MIVERQAAGDYDSDKADACGLPFNEVLDSA